MKIKNPLQKITERFGLLAEALPGVPLIEICGADRILIENHRCILAYNTDRITVLLKYGPVTFLGEGLQLGYMQKDQILIQGTIHTVIVKEADRYEKMDQG